jgi:S1-C subfamily serine protease
MPPKPAKMRTAERDPDLSPWSSLLHFARLIKRIRVQDGLVGIVLGLCFASLRASNPEADIRRDATVWAVENVMPAVVNIGTETLLASRSPVDELFREFFDPYHREREADSNSKSGEKLWPPSNKSSIHSKKNWP